MATSDSRFSTPEVNNSSNKIDRSTYLRHIHRARNAGNWFICSRIYVTSGLMDHQESMFFQDLLNIASMGDGEWVICQEEYLYETSGWSHDMQWRLFKKLKKRGYVETCKKGIPAKRYIRVDIVRVEEDLDACLQKRGAKPPVTAISRQQVPEKPSHRDFQMTGDLENQTTNRDKDKEIKKKDKNPLPPSPPDGGSVAGGGCVDVPKIKKRKSNLREKPVTPLRSVPKGQSPQDVDRATRLYHAAQKKGEAKPNEKLSPSIKQFKLLRDADGVPDKEIEEVLTAYLPLMKNKYMPHAFCGYEFRQKYIAIRRRIKESTCVDEPVELDQVHQDMLERLLNRHWPKGSALQLPKAILQIEREYDEWRDKLIKFRDSKPPTSKGESNRALARHLLLVLDSPREFTEQWLVDTSKRVENWAAWSGTISKFSPNDIHFVRMLQDIVEGYTNDRNRWSELERELRGLSTP